MYLTVGEISKALGISPESIRYYVKEGIITPRKNSENNYWEYSSDDLLKVIDVLFYRSTGLTIDEIKQVINGQTLDELHHIIDERQMTLIREIKERTDTLARLSIWKESLTDEMELIGKYKIGELPSEFRRNAFFEDDNHLARYLEENFDFDKEDWCNVSMSFYYNIHEEASKLRRYFSVAGVQKVKPKNLNIIGIEERIEHCLITEVHYSDIPQHMIQPMIDYAKDNDIVLEGTFYGRENTGYYINGKRNSLYRVYAPILK